MKQLLFFALRDDLLEMIQAVERAQTLKYVLMGQFPSADLQCFDEGAQIPNLGSASAESAINCESYLVALHGTSLSVRSRSTAAGADRYFVDQLVNPDTITFTPGGIWHETVLLHGRVATISESGPSRDLMKAFSAVIRKQFSKVKAYHLGSNARKFLEQGNRLTISAQSPPQFDLQIP
jgi:hypothetical protein